MDADNSQAMRARCAPEQRNPIRLVGFDGDDTLWRSQDYFDTAQLEFERIVGAYVGPFTSIGNDVVIQDSEIEHSIVLEGSCVRDLANRVIDSLIGRNVRIYREPVKPSAYRFMLGDNSEVGIRW